MDRGEPESPHGSIKNVGAPRLLNFRIPEAHVSSNQIRCFNHYIAENGMVIQLVILTRSLFCHRV